MQSTDSAANSCEDFPTTSWALIREAQQATSKRRAALLDGLFRRYWRPLYAYFLAKCGSADDASNLVLRLRERFVHGGMMLQTDPAKGRLRVFLIVCARNLVIDEARRKRTRAGTPEQAVPFGVLDGADGQPFDPSGGEGAEAAFHDAWRRDVVARALADVRDACRAVDRERDFDLFMERYASGAKRMPTWKEVGKRYGLEEGKASNRGEWVKEQLRKAIRAQVGHYAKTGEEIEEEIGDLLS